MRSFSKKALAVMLSALMVLTTMPFAAITAYADDAAITAYNNAVDAYSSKMDGTVYTNMGTVYNAFVDANEAYDAYVYGQGTAAALTSATNALVSATATLDNDHKWTRSNATAKVYSRDNTTTPISSAYAKNILYADNQDTLVDENASNTKNVRVQIQYGANNVLMYDGTNDILFPVAVFYYYDQTGTSSRKMFTMYPYKDGQTGSWEASNFPDDNDDFRLQGQWKGSMDYGTADWNDRYANGGELIPGYLKEHGSAPDGAPAGNRKKWNYFANYMKYIGGANGFSNGLRDLQVDWFAFTGYSSSQNRVAHTLDNAGHIYIIDYASSLAAIDAKKSLLSQAGDYKCGGMSTLLNAYDKMTIDVAGANYASNPGGTAATVATSLSDGAAAANGVTTPDTDAGYEALRAAITQAKVTYEEGNDDNFYASNLWNTFKAAYDAAIENMNNLPSNGYSPSAAAQTLADRLNTAYNNLINSVQVIDTTALEAAIDDALYAIDNASYFTAASFTNANLASVVEAAQVAVWQSVAQYKSMRAKGQTTEETVAAQLANVKAAVLKLVVDKNKTVSSAGGYSANSVIAYAQDTSVFTPNDYANWNVVTEAVTAATNFDGAISTYVDNCAASKISEYVAVVKSVITALNNLKDAFSKMKNGQLIKTGNVADTTTAEGAPNGDSGSVKWRTYFNGYDNSVVFRTDHSAAYLTLPDSFISYNNTSGYHAGLDSVNFGSESTNTDRQLTAVGNNENGSLDSAFISENKINGGLIAKNDGTNSKSGRLAFGKVDGRDDSGMFVNSSQVAAITDNIYAIDSNNSNPLTTAGTVDEENYFTADVTDLLGTLDSKDNFTSNNNMGMLGGIFAANNGTTQVKVSTSLFVTQEPTSKLSATTRPTVDTYTFTDKLFDSVQWWRWSSWISYSYHGFRRDYAYYSRTVQVVDVTYLFKLIDECDNAGYVENEYTNATWTAYSNALSAAKADMDYSEQDASTVLNLCVTRYNNLWNARNALVKAADRSALVAARDEVKNIVDAGQISDAYGGPWSDATWTPFIQYYNAIVTDLNNKYSATGVRDFAYYATGSTTTKSEAQQDIEARAAQLIVLKNALQSNADFTPLDNAVTALHTKVVNGQFTTASIAACNEALGDVEYFWYTEAQRKAVFASDEADVAIAAAAAAVTAAGDLLVAVDDDVVNNASDIAGAARARLDAIDFDPDAYDTSAIDAVINALVATTPNAVVFTDNAYYGELKTVGYTYKTMAEVDAIVTDALYSSFKTYDVVITGVSDAEDAKFEYTLGGVDYTVNGANLNDVPYGTQIRVYAPNSKFVKWYYTYESATAGATYKEKYLTNDNVINFVVNGDITFRLDNETDVKTGDKAKVTYANSLRNVAYNIEYVDKNTEITLPEAPTVAKYDFVNYTVDGTDYGPGDPITITKNTLIVANYEYAEDESITIYLANLGGSIDGYLAFDAEYNQKVELTYDGLTDTSTRGTGYVTIDDEHLSLSPKKNIYTNLAYAESSIYAYTVIAGSLLETDDEGYSAFEPDGMDYSCILETRNEESLNYNPSAYPEGAETVLAYGQDYTFYASENMVIIPYTKAQFDAAVAAGFIDSDYVDDNGATVFASSNIVHAGTKLSIISNYVLPEGCELVEAGILITATKDGTKPNRDLTFKNVSAANEIYRMKSTQHTVGNQFVISPIQVTTALKGKTINAQYAAYVIYTKDGNTYSVISNPVEASIIA